MPPPRSPFGKHSGLPTLISLAHLVTGGVADRFAMVEDFGEVLAAAGGTDGLAAAPRPVCFWGVYDGHAGHVSTSCPKCESSYRGTRC